MSSDIRATVYEGAVAVTPTDSTAIGPFAALYIGGAGTVTVTDIKGNKTEFFGALAGTIIPIQGTIVWSTGTSATHIVMLQCKPIGA